jgi:hypothetical protein
MPRYYFDIHDGRILTRDQDGLELKDIEAAKDEAVRALPGIAKDELPGGNRRDFVITVRNEAGQAVLRVTLSLCVETVSA